MSKLSNGAIVIGRDYGALGVVRSLGRREIPVCLLEEAPSNVSVSRYATFRHAWPSDEPAQLALLHTLAINGHAGWTIIPASDEAAATIARNHGDLRSRYTLTTPPWDVMKWAYDKRLTYQLAERAGVIAPKTIVPRDAAELDELDWVFPLIIKPAIKPESNDLTAAKAWRVDDRVELRARFEEASALADPSTLLVQELIPGGGEAQLSFVALCQAGAPIAWMTARRTRQYPIDFGKYSTYVESIDCPEIEEPSRRLIAEMQYDGLVEIEYKRDPRSNELKPLDINGRVWAWHTLGARAGVDFTYLQWRLANDLPVEPTRGRAGVRWMRGLTDVPASIAWMRAGELSLWEYLRSLRPSIEFALFAWDDLVPWVADVPFMVLRHRQRSHSARSSSPTSNSTSPQGVSSGSSQAWAPGSSRRLT